MKSHPSSSQSLSQKILNSGYYKIEYNVTNLGGTSTKIDSFIVFENSSLEDFWEVKLKNLQVKIRKSNAEKVNNQGTFLFLYDKIDRMKSQVPNWVFDYFTKTTLWIDDINKPNSAAAYHPSKEWLVENGYMKEKAKGVELFNLFNYVDWTKRAQPDMLLHEYAHAYHDQIMTNGFNNKMILDAYNKSIASKKYELVDYILGGQVKHYATTNQMEYFAEITEAYFGKNDMYPFTKNELKSFDTGAYELIEKIWVTGLKDK